MLIGATVTQWDIDRQAELLDGLERQLARCIQARDQCIQARDCLQSIADEACKWWEFWYKMATAQAMDGTVDTYIAQLESEVVEATATTREREWWAYGA